MEQKNERSHTSESAAGVFHLLYHKQKSYLFGILLFTFTFTFMHLADAFIQSDLQLHSGYTFFSSVFVFPGNRTHNPLRC